MPVAELRLIKHHAEFLPQSEVYRIPKLSRGIYVLYKYRRKTGMYDVVYIGMAGGEIKAGIAGRLRSHVRRKKDKWTHFSAYEVWDNVRPDEIRELEGILRHIFRKDTRANTLAIQKRFIKLRHVEKQTIKESWLKPKKK